MMKGFDSRVGGWFLRRPGARANGSMAGRPVGRAVILNGRWMRQQRRKEVGAYGIGALGHWRGGVHGK